MNDIRDVKPPIDLPVSWWWLLWAALALAAAAALAYFLLKRPRPAAPPAPPLPQRSAWEIAKEQMEGLRHKHYPEKGLFKAFYSGLSDIVRHYLEDRFNIRAPEMTTEEFLNYARTSSALTPAQKEFLRDFLNGCDLVKFARYVPGVHDAQANFDLAQKLIDETK